MYLLYIHVMFLILCLVVTNMHNIEECVIVVLKNQLSNISSISWREQVNFQ
jgi:hypothetical protein